ncbi:YobA family protein [Coriobacteriia bacterium Es71-Z0120]|jgi:uncharacterized protein (DUF39 family)|uniref:DUF3221 domain-containing protein n=1 Tax=Parvivirga hydrogeniphila TaxID=2939460 RepID=UPI002260CF5B|nr:DUF3221 domain-containing protein [Parvivirga hydrogeniphila]MCL4078083.1 YobA family protein [Parvivirga hydrogeniphila]
MQEGDVSWLAHEPSSPEARLKVREVGGAYERAAFSDIAVGQTLDVWTTGQVAESYPLQAWATAVVIRTAK